MRHLDIRFSRYSLAIFIRVLRHYLGRSFAYCSRHPAAKNPACIALDGGPIQTGEPD